MLNARLFARLNTVWRQRDSLPLDAESQRLMAITWQRFQLAGASLNEQQKAQLKILNQQAASLSTQFTHRLLAATKSGGLSVDDPAVLAGLSTAELDAAAQAASEKGLQGKWLLALQNTTQQPALQDLRDRKTRETLFSQAWRRAEKNDDNDTRSLVAQLASVRARQAQLLGFDSFAHWNLQDQMAKTPQAALSFMREIVPAATARARREAADIQQIIDDQQGGFRLAPWDWLFYAEQVRKAKYALDDSQITPYFELNSVLENGVFYAATQLFGITFKSRSDIPVYHPEVRVYEIIDHDGTPMALFYADFFSRDNKGGGAWMGNFVGQSTLSGTRPVIYNVCNLVSRQPANLRCSPGMMLSRCSMNLATRCTVCLLNSVTPACLALKRRAILLNFLLSAMSIGPAIRRSSETLPATIKLANPCLRRCTRKSSKPVNLTKVMI